jgi:hypothetical protein
MRDGPSTATRSEEGVADAELPVPRRAELGQFGGDVDLDRAEEVDVFSLCAGEMCASTSSSIRRPSRRICSTARP